MKKRLISLLLVLCMVVSLLPATALAVAGEESTATQQTNPFTDVKESDWFYAAVRYAKANGFFNGTSATTFNPDGTMTRGMFVTVLGRMAGIDPVDYAEQTPFTDVPADQYYAPYVVWAEKYGITGGVGDGLFAPDLLINREQMAAMLVRYFEAFGVNYAAGADIDMTPADLVCVSDYAKEAVLKLWKSGLLNGDGKNFNPDGNASRA